MTTQPLLTPYQSQYYAWLLTRRAARDTVESLASTLVDSQVDLNPHQVEAALFACKNPLSRGVILADEVGLGKTIEAGLVISQRWAERRRRILIIVPANLRKQWHQELQDKFGLQALILEAKNYNTIRKQEQQNPFLMPMGPVVCSYQFAKSKIADVKDIEWDLVVMDEAHRMRNVYKTSNVIAKALKEALAHVHSKVLLTATPLQNSLLELYGLVSMIDDRVFGDLDSFRSQFSQPNREEAFAGLRARIAPICKRTLRRQVQQYVPYTARRAIVEEFTPSAEEKELSILVADYLRRPNLKALPDSQRQLISLVLWKLLASSTHAIAGALETMAKRLQAVLDETPDVPELVDQLDEDYESLDETAEEWSESDGNGDSETSHRNERNAVTQEIAELRHFKTLAINIRDNSKGKALLTALERAFAELDRLGAAKKAIIFTESRKTQDYLLSLLADTHYGEGIVLFNGTNSDPRAQAVYKDWLKRHEGSDKISGSKTADTRAALVEHFQERGTVMIATEAGAEGINLQFCSLVINYDLPWNPQRVEQRIGRCHRYGQRFDVVVINFLNTRNQADQRVLELLTEKFKLFSGVFGASDEVLGRIEGGLDFEKRILQIYDTCRQPAQIEAAFNALQAELEESIADRIKDTQSQLLEHFDEDVHDRLKLRLDEAEARLDKLGRWFWGVTRYALHDRARFDEQSYAFSLTTPPAGIAQLAPVGRYQLIRGAAQPDMLAHAYRLSHPLGEWSIATSLNAATPVATVKLDYDQHGARVSVIERLRGKSGWLTLARLEVTAFETTEALLFSGLTDDGQVLDQETCEKLMALPAAAKPAPLQEFVPKTLLDNSQQAVAATISGVLEANQRLFHEERDKLERWADDKLLAAEEALKNTKARIAQLKRDARKAATLQEQDGIQRELAEQERKQRRQRQEVFEVEDEIIAKRDALIASLQQRLQEKTSHETLFSIRWQVT